MALISVVLTFSTPVHAGGATRIEGIGYFADPNNECINDVEGNSSDFALLMTGDLQGCLYVFVADSTCQPSGTYRETGTEIFVGQYNGVSGVFETAYLFTAKFGTCPDLATEIWGRCQHPIVRGSGLDGFDGVTGRFDIKDDIVAGNFPYKGHLRW
jgi:hypothetical protein